MTASVAKWVNEEFLTLDLGDSRLNQRFRSIMLELSRHCSKNLASCFDCWAKIKASYRVFSNPKVTEQAMLAPHILQTAQRIQQHATVLLIQDSTYLDYSSRPKTANLDLTQRSKYGKAAKGLLLHNTLAVSTEGLPLGLVDQRFIDRKSFHGDNAQEKKAIRHCNSAIEDKESARWIDVLKTVKDMDFGNTKIVHMADRECDIYEFFRDASVLQQSVLIRAARNRAINKKLRREPPSCLLFDKITSMRSQGSVTVKIQVNGVRKYRNAKLSIVRMPFSMPPPSNKTVKKDGNNLPMVPLIAVMATERRPPKGEEPLHWVLLTNLAVDTLDQAIEKVQWYTTRWNIETFHKVLKSGYGVEKAQLQCGERLRKYAILKSMVAWRLFWLSRLHEHDAAADCGDILTKQEWTLLYRKIHKTRVVPSEAPTIAEVFIWIARLGGYIARASDPPPGVISLWRGWQRLSEIVDDHRDIYG